MGIESVPAKWRYKCDGCGNVETVETVGSRPKYWTDLHWRRDAYDFQGEAVADGSIARMLCGGCSDVLLRAVNDAFVGKLGRGKID